MRSLPYLLPWLALGAAAPSAASQVVINEFVSSNVESLTDEDGDSPDWIELHNTGATDVDLDGWGLSDDPGDPFRWTLPKVVLPADGYLLLFASGKDRRLYANTFDTIVSDGMPWRYAPGVAEPPADWRTVGFAETGWLTGPSGFGFGDGDDNTIVNANTVYARFRFTATQAQIDATEMLFLHVDHDDGYVAYLNDVEIARSNMAGVGNHPSYDTLASDSHEALLYQNFTLPGTHVANFASIVQPGPNVLAIQVHNAATNSSDLSLIPFLTLGTATPTPGGGDPRLEIPSTTLHTNFKLDALGETIQLHDAGGALVDSVDTGRMYVDVSRGRHPSGGSAMHYFGSRTPGRRNSTLAVPELSGPVTASVEGGFYPGAVTVSLTPPAAGAEIFYTLDGSDPTPSHSLYTGPVHLNRISNLLRARAFETGKGPGEILTNTYVIGVPPTLPVFSLATDPPNLWDTDTGIYVLGNDYFPFFPYFGANFWQDWERPVHVEYFDLAGSRQLALDAGMRIHGGWSRGNDQKSLRLYSRAGYEQDDFDYPFFAGSSVSDYRRILLRNSGNDFLQATMRDAFMHELTRGEDLDAMEYQPTLVILNGQYWGIHNLRERQDKYYLENRHDIDPDEVDLLQFTGDVVEGDSVHYDAMIDFVDQNPMSVETNYRWVETQMDVENYAAYQAFQIFYANTDWPQNNIKFWRPRTPDGKWRWLLYDTDGGLGLFDSPGHNTLWWAKRNGGGQETLLFRNLLESPIFRNAFVNRYADYMNTRLESSAASSVFAAVRDGIEPSVNLHYDYWGSSRSVWDAHVAEIQDFLVRRPGIARNHVVQEFGLAGTYELDLDVQPAGAGRIALTAIEVDGAWDGLYFRGIPVALTAVPNGGYEFDSWSDGGLPQTPSVTIDPPGNYTLTARFRLGGEHVVLQEINYNSSPTFDPGDWVELHNNTDVAVDLTGWAFEDEGNRYEFPAGTSIPARGHLVLCEDLAAFQALFPGVTTAIGDLGFGFRGSGERLRLRDAGNGLHDEVEYDDEPPWPTEPDGQGPTLELIDPNLDNADPASWRASTGNGSPGT